MPYSFDPPENTASGYSFEPPATRKPWDATGVSFGKKSSAARSGTQRDVMGIATPAERKRPVTPANTLLKYTYAGNLLLGPDLPTRKQLQNMTEPTPEVQRQMVSKGVDMALGTNVDRQTIEPLITGFKTLKNKLAIKGLPFSDKRNAFRAATQFANAQAPGTPVADTANKLRQTETDALINRLKPTVTPTPGQGSGNYRSAALEQSMTSKDPAFAERLKYNDAELNKAAVNNLTGALGKPADLPFVQPREVTGANQVKTIKSAMKPVLSKEAEMWADVPTYPMPAENTATAFKTVLGTPSTARKAVQNVYAIFKQTPRTVEGLQTVEREINSAMKAGTDTDRHFLRQIKQAVQDDFEAMGRAAETGDVALHNGEIVYPSKLRAELAGVEERLIAEQSKAAEPDVKAMAQALAKKGVPAMRQTAETEAAYAQRVAKDYKSAFPGQEAPTVAGESKALTDLTARKTALTDQLANLQPAEDVAVKYAAVKRYSREEKFERFYRGAVQDVLESGDQASGMRIPAEQVPNKFFTPTGSKDLIRAVGKQQAAEQSMPYAVEQLITKTVDANTGVMNVSRAVAWVRQNAATLDNLGLTESVNRVIKGQIPRAIEAELETKAVDVLGNPSATVLQAAKLIKKYGPAVEKMYGAKGMQALRDYGQMMEVIGRNKYVSYSKGSTTIEKGFGDQAASMAEKVSALAAVSTGHGWQFSAVKNLVKSFMEVGLAGNERKVTALLQEALVNPQAAEALMKIAKARPANVAAITAKYVKPIIIQLQVSGKLATTTQEEPNATP